MKKKKNKIPSERLGAREQTNKKNMILWWTFLTVVITTGIRLILKETWGSLDPGFLGSLLAGLAGLAVCVESELLKKRMESAYGSLLLLIPWPFLMILTGITGPVQGTKIWINIIITRWNAIHEGGVSLFDVHAGTGAANSLTLIVVLASVEIFWLLISEHHIIIGNIIFLFWILAQLVSGVLSPLGCGFFLAGLAGMWITDKRAAPAIRQIIWTAGILLVSVAMAFFMPAKEIIAVRNVREAVKNEIHRIRYGEDTLPEGDLYNAAELKASEGEMLEVQTEQEKNLYLKGFTGSVYQNGRWKTQPDSTYGGDYAGMLKWLSENGFDPLNQVSEYYSCGEENKIPEKNTIKVENTGASRYYVYAPYSLEKITKGKTREKKDSGLMGKGFFGTKEYQLKEISTSRPSELTVADNWVTDPTSEEQKQYTKAEAVYRSFVYDTYRTVDKETKDLIQEMFWDDYDTESDGIYSAITRIRDVLKKSVQYTDYPEETPEGEDPVRWFLTESGEGNAMLYASVAVDALRVHGIPARYVEGYYVSSSDAEKAENGTVSVTGESAHAWAEAYFDGIGWLPLDVTPGYYYDAVTLQKMVSSPDVVQKNAILKNNSYGAEEVTGMEGENQKSVGQKLIPVVKDIGAFCLGILAVLLILAVLGLIVCEIIRSYCIWHTEKTYKNASHAEQIGRIEKAIHSWMALVGIEAHLGWNTKETDQILAERFEKIEPGEYTRVCELIEKVVYGGMELEPFEVRTLSSFFSKLTEIGRKGELRYRLMLRYAFAWKNRR